jgi:hypothetical protein
MDPLLRVLLTSQVLFTAPSLQSKPQKRVCFLPLFQEIRRVSFELAQNDLAAFHTILAIASADRSILHDEKEPVQAIAHNTYSIRLLNERISNAEDATTDRTLTTVALQIIFLVGKFQSPAKLQRRSSANTSPSYCLRIAML